MTADIQNFQALANTAKRKSCGLDVLFYSWRTCLAFTLQHKGTGSQHIKTEGMHWITIKKILEFFPITHWFFTADNRFIAALLRFIWQHKSYPRRQCITRIYHLWAKITSHSGCKQTLYSLWNIVGKTTSKSRQKKVKWPLKCHSSPLRYATPAKPPDFQSAAENSSSVRNSHNQWKLGHCLVTVHYAWTLLKCPTLW